MEHILITGANRGIGFELVRQFAQRNDTHVFAGARKPKFAVELQDFAKDCAGQVTIIPLDVADTASIQSAVREVQKETDALDMLINNAGINPKGIQSLGQIEVDTMMNVFQVNTVGALMVTKGFLPLLENGRRKRIVNVSSQVGSMAWKEGGGGYAYAASKAGMNMITRCLAADLKSQGFITITLHPGWVQTDMGGSGAPLTPEESVSGIMSLVERLTPADNGGYFKWDGTVHPW